jgi:hypothetical protein
MVQAIRYEKTGGPEVFTWRQVSVDRSGPGGRESGDVDGLMKFVDGCSICRDRSGFIAPCRIKRRMK